MSTRRSNRKSNYRIVQYLFFLALIIVCACFSAAKNRSIANQEENTQSEGAELENTFTLSELWDNVESIINTMGRPDRLYTVEPSKTALIVVDMQQGFCAVGSSIEIPSARDIVPNINKLISIARKKDFPIIWIRFVQQKNMVSAGFWPLMQPSSPWSYERARPTEVFAEEGEGIPIWEELDYRPNVDITVDKNRYSAFTPGSSDLERVLRTLGIDTIIIAGIASDVCSGATARDAMQNDFKVIFVSDANSTVNEVLHQISLMNIKMFYGDVVRTDNLIEEIENLSVK